ncbi:hypothetical protein MRX96_016437 [Rhipicephalus microplus]
MSNSFKRETNRLHGHSGMPFMRVTACQTTGFRCSRPVLYDLRSRPSSSGPPWSPLSQMQPLNPVRVQ